jgi:hypothetical protein
MLLQRLGVIGISVVLIYVLYRKKYDPRAAKGTFISKCVAPYLQRLKYFFCETQYRRTRSHIRTYIRLKKNKTLFLCRRKIKHIRITFFRADEWILSCMARGDRQSVGRKMCLLPSSKGPTQVCKHSINMCRECISLGMARLAHSSASVALGPTRQ